MKKKYIYIIDYILLCLIITGCQKPIDKNYQNNTSNKAIENINSKLVPPKNVIATKTDTDRILINWEAVAGAKMYRVIRFVENDTTPYAGSWQSECSFSDMNAIPGVEYYYCVQACEDKLKEDSYSDFSTKVAGQRKKETKSGLSYMWIDY